MNIIEKFSVFGKIDKVDISCNEIKSVLSEFFLKVEEFRKSPFKCRWSYNLENVGMSFGQIKFSKTQIFLSFGILSEFDFVNTLTIILKPNEYSYNNSFCNLIIDISFRNKTKKVFDERSSVSFKTDEFDSKVSQILLPLTRGFLKSEVAD